MRTRITKLAAGLTVVSALAVGGASLASAKSKTPAKAPVAALDQDTLQQGDQSAPDTASESSSAEQPAASEQAGSGSEVAGNDGPGGHADEPGNANADHQFNGAE